MGPGELVHRFVVAGERSRLENDDTAEATRGLREMISSGRLSKLMPTRDASGGIVTKLIEQDGPIAFIESTTLGKIFEEDLNRCVALVTDEQPQQTQRILAALASSRSGRHPARDPIVQPSPGGGSASSSAPSPRRRPHCPRTSIYMMDAPRTLSEIVAAAHLLAGQHGCKVIAVDHLHLVNGEPDAREKGLRVAAQMVDWARSC